MATKRNLLSFLILTLMLALTLPFAQSVKAAPLAATITVTNANDSGAGSLRQAVLNAASGDTIMFAGNYSIRLASELLINKNLTINGDGYTVTLSGDTNGDGSGETRVLNIALGSSVTLNKLNIVKGNVANGAGLVNAGTLTVSNSTFIDNKGTGTGGAIYSNGSLTVTNSTFSGNSAASGGAIYLVSGTLAIVNSTFSGNAATSGGGGIYRSGGTATLTNTILANSTAGGNCNGSIINGGHNIDDGITCGFASNNHSSSGTNPLLAPLGNYGGPTQTFALLPGSPALDAGDDAICGTVLGYLDQRGVSRLSSLCDMGSYESRGFTLVISGGNAQSTPINSAFPQSLVVTLSETGGYPLPGAVITYTAPVTGAGAMWNGSTTITATTNINGIASSTAPTANGVIGSYGVNASVNGGTPSVVFTLTNLCSSAIKVINTSDDGAGSLRQAIANSCGGGTITFDGNYTIRLASRLIVNKNLRIDGAGRTIIISGDTDADGTGNTSLFLNDTAATTTLNQLKLTKGRVNTGGGIWNNGILTITNSTLSDNSATVNDAGGVYNAGTLNVISSTFSNNSAASNGGGIYNAGTLTVSNSTFIDNKGTGTGGAIYSNGSLIVTNSTFSGNAATSGGGGIYRSGGTATLTNTILANSTAGGNCNGSIINGGHNIDDGITCGFASNNHSSSGTNPLLAPLGNYGGPTQTFALLPGSPALDAGDDAICGTVLGYLDQRGVSRPSSLCDMGSYESRGFTLVISGGNAQSTPINSAFPQSLVVTLSETGGYPLPGAMITYTAPVTGASAMWNGSTTITATTNINGIASSTAPTANGVGGAYGVNASVNGGTPSVVFTLTNLCSSAIKVINASDDGAGSLRQAIANSCGGGTITFDGNYTIRLASRLIVNKNLRIDGAGRTIIISGDTDADGTGNTSLFLNDTAATTTLNQLKLTKGRVNTGGGIWNNGILTITNSTLSDNSATVNDAGGVYNAGTLNVISSTFSNNSAASNGGGIYNAGTLNVNNSTLGGNSAANSGGGIFINSGIAMMTINNSTLSGNSATFGGSIYKGSGTVMVKNTILSNSSSGGNCSDVVTNGGYNLDDGTTCGFGADNHSMSGTAPLLSSLADHSGPTQTFALLPGSPAIDTGDSASCPATDQRGVKRPQGKRCDIGAFELKQFTISGNAGKAGVALKYTDGIAKTATSASNGNYSFTVSIGWSGTVTPSKSGYIFKPASKTYTNVISNKVKQNYVTVRVYVISGNAGMAGVKLTYKDGTTKTVISDSSGKYSFKVPYGWSGKVTPSKSCYAFTPASRTYAKVAANRPNQNYKVAPVTYTISGNAGTDSATLSYTDGSPKTVTSNSSGAYSLLVSCKWSGTVTPSKTGYTFTPPSQSYTNVLANKVNQNYTAAIIMYTISGNAGVGNALLHYEDNGAKTVQADSGGIYTIPVPYNWSGVVTPSKAGSIFTPENTSYSNVLSDQPNQDYTTVSTSDLFTVSGNAGVEGVVLTYQEVGAAPQTVIAGTGGDYSFSVLYNWSGTVTPTLANYAFSPANRVYLPFRANQTAQDYTAIALTVETFTSIAAEDGWVLELNETSNVGGSFNSALSYFRVGDDAKDRQYKSILSFDTSSLPENAIIISAVLKVKKSGALVGNPFTVLGDLRVGIRTGFYGTSSALAANDFQAKDTLAGIIQNAPVNSWYSSTLSSAGWGKINKTGLTQLRLYFVKDDNDNNAADFIQFLSGNSANSKPQLVVTYTIP